MTVRTNYSIAVCVAALLVGCAKSSEKSDQGTGQGTGGMGSGGASGVAGSQHASTGGESAGTGGKPSVGTGGVGGSTCPPDTAIPTLCRLCNGNSCGTPTCSGGKFIGFSCPPDADAGTDGSGGSSVCNLACAKGKHCERKPTATCVDDAIDAGVDAGGEAKTSCGGGTGKTCPGMGACVSPTGCDPMTGGADCPGQCSCYVELTCPEGKVWVSSPDACDCVPTGEVPLHWFRSCGSPVCSALDGIFDDANIPNCTTQEAGQPCTTASESCDGVFTCGSVLICAAQMPVRCPVSRASYKQDIRYLDDVDRAQFHDQLTHLPLASYRYKTAPDVPQLGFMIDDIEPSVAVSGDHVNLYGYLSMAVAAIQVQDRQLKVLEQQVESLRAQLDESSSEALCTPDRQRELARP